MLLKQATLYREISKNMPTKCRALESPDDYYKEQVPGYFKDLRLMI